MLFLRPVYLNLTGFHPRLEDVTKIHRYFTCGVAEWVRMLPDLSSIAGTHKVEAENWLP